MKITLLLVCFVASVLVASAQQPKMICKLNDGTEKQYNIADIEKLSMMKSNDPSYLTVFYNGTSCKFTTTQIDSITLHNSVLTIFSKPTGFTCTLAEVDSVVTQKIIQSQAPSIEWQKCLGGRMYDYATSIQQTSDGGYIVAGNSSSNNGDVTGNHHSYDYWVVKLTLGGSLEWQKSLGGSRDERAYSIQQTSDGGYIVAGESETAGGDVMGNHGECDFWIVKLSSVGSLEWQKSLGGSGNDGAYSIQQTSDGGYIVVGSTGANYGDITGFHGGWDYFIVKLTSGGSIEWQKSLGGSFDDSANSVHQTSDGGYIIAGVSKSNDGDVTGNHGLSDFWIVKLTSSGTIEWQKSLGGSDEDYAYSIQQTSDNGYIIAGWTGSSDGDVTITHSCIDSWIVKLTSDGTVEWQKSLGGSRDEHAYFIYQTSNGGYVIAGQSNSNDGDVTGNHGDHDFWVVKLTSDGSIEWQKSFGGSDEDYAESMQQTSDGGYIVAGWSYSNDGDVSGNHGISDYWIVKLKAP